MVNAIIIKDETSSMEYLMSILKRNHQNINILGWATNVDDAVKLIESETPEIVFLDIQLLDGNGFDVLDHLKDNMTFEVIFTTGYHCRMALSSIPTSFTSKGPSFVR